MSSLRRDTALIGCLLIIGCSAAEPPAIVARPNNEWFVPIADGLSEECLKATAREFQALVGTRAAPGDVIHVVSVPSHAVAGTLIVPEGPRDRRLRDRQVVAAMAGIVPLLMPQPTIDGGQVQLPCLLSTIRALRRTEFPCRVIIVGDPVHHDPRLPGSSMRGSRVPSDGTLSAELSPYFISSLFPPETTVSWLAPSADWGSNEPHRHAVTRFHRLWFQEQGARLVRVTSDAAAAFDFDHPQFDGTVARRDEESRMKDVALVDLQTGNPSTDEQPIRPVPPPAPEPAPPPAPVVRDEAVDRSLKQAEANLGQIAIAIGWRSDDPLTDLDIHLSDSKRRGEDISHLKTQTSFGKLLRDVRKSGVTKTSNFQETWECVLVNHDRLQDLTLWINAYRLERPATLRVIRIWNGSRREFTVPFPGSSGDAGKDASRRHESPAWLKVNL